MPKPKITFEKVDPDEQIVLADGVPVGLVQRYEYTSLFLGPRSWREVYRWAWSPGAEVLRHVDLESDDALAAGRRSFTHADDIAHREQELGTRSYDLRGIKKAVRDHLRSLSEPELAEGKREGEQWVQGIRERRASRRPNPVDPRSLEVR